MIRFECRACHEGLYLSQVGTWLEGEPFCGAQCSDRVDVDALREGTPSLSEHLEALPGLLNDVGSFVRNLIEFTERAAAAQQAVENAERASQTIGQFSFLAGVIATASTSSVEASYIDLTQELWSQFFQLHGLMVDVVRRSMALHAAGYSMPPALASAIQTCQELDADYPSSAGAQLREMFGQLEAAHGQAKAFLTALQR